MVKIRLLLIALVCILFLASAIVFKVVLGTCVVDDSRSFLSPGSDHEAKLLVSSCGATVSQYTDVEVDDRRIFSVKYLHMDDTKVYWTNDRELIIEYSGDREDFFMHREFYRDVHIVLRYMNVE